MRYCSFVSGLVTSCWGRSRALPRAARVAADMASVVSREMSVVIASSEQGSSLLNGWKVESRDVTRPESAGTRRKRPLLCHPEERCDEGALWTGAAIDQHAGDE